MNVDFAHSGDLPSCAGSSGMVWGDALDEGDHALNRCVEGEVSLNLEGEESLDFGALEAEGIRMAFWWKEPLTVSVS